MPVASGSPPVAAGYGWLEDQDTTEHHIEPPNRNEWYEILSDSLVNIIYVHTWQNNDENNAKDIELRATLDGQVYTGSISQAFGTSYLWYRYPRPAAYTSLYAQTIATEICNFCYRAKKPAHAASIEMRITSALGTNQKLWGEVTYDKLVGI